MSSAPASTRCLPANGTANAAWKTRIRWASENANASITAPESLLGLRGVNAQFAPTGGESIPGPAYGRRLIVALELISIFRLTTTSQAKRVSRLSVEKSMLTRREYEQRSGKVMLADFDKTPLPFWLPAVCDQNLQPPSHRTNFVLGMRSRRRGKSLPQQTGGNGILRPVPRANPSLNRNEH